MFILPYSDRGVLIWDGPGPKKKEREKEILDPAFLYSQAALPITSETVGLFRFLMMSTEWCDIVEEELLRPLILMSDKLVENSVRNKFFSNYLYSICSYFLQHRTRTFFLFHSTFAYLLLLGGLT